MAAMRIPAGPEIVSYLAENAG